MNILEALDDPNLFTPMFQPRESWEPWRAALAAIQGVAMTPAELQHYRTHTGRTTPPTAPAREAWFIVGRRGGKSRIAALLAVYYAAFKSYALAPGERGVVMVLAADRRQARVCFRYVTGLVDGCPMVAALVADRTTEALRLTNGVDIEIHTSSFKSVRGYTTACVILDEVAYWPSDDAANPDTEIVAALRPGMASVPDALMVGISSPYARRGELWKAHERHYGKDGDRVLVWQASTASMNATIDPDVIARAYEDDPARAAAEYGAEFRRDVEGYVSREAIDACIVLGRRELLPASGVAYTAFVDPSGGSVDSFTMAIAHHEDGRVVLDCVRERRPPFSPDGICEEFAATLKLYGLASVSGDRYAGQWPRERFRVHGVDYVPAEMNKSALYGALLPLLNAGRVELLDDRRLVAQLLGLERRTARGGRDSIDHAPSSHDDVSNAAAGALVAAEEDSQAVAFDPLAVVSYG